MSSRVIPDCERIAEHADEQAALRRIATLVARGAPAPQIYDAVAEEVGPLLGAEITAIQSYEPDGYTTLLGSWGKLRDVFPHTSQLLLINDSSSGAGVLLESTRIRGILRMRQIIEADFGQVSAGQIGRKNIVQRGWCEGNAECASHSRK